MRIHHLNLATMCPFAPRSWIADPDDGGEGKLVCHALLIETDDGLVLVDTGFGMGDVTSPKHLGRPFITFTRPALDPNETALRQVERLGFKASDVRHIVPTHLDLDHAGGLPDFPDARVHIYARELEAVQARRTLAEKERYRPAHFAHGPKWESYEVEGEPWLGFECVRDLRGLPPEILIVPLVGHTRGHAAIAVQTEAGWLVHAGDGYFFRGEMEATPRCPPGLRIFQEQMGIDRFDMQRNKERLRLLRLEQEGGTGPKIEVFCAHDPIELRRYAASA